MHIAFNGWFWNRPDTGSGQYTRRLVEALSESADDLRLTVILPSANTEADQLPDRVNVRVATPPVGGSPGKVWFEQISFPRAAARENADIIHIPYWAPPLSSPKPVVTTIHDIIPLSMPEYRGGPLVRLYTSLVAAGTRGATHCLTDSQASRHEIIDRLAIEPDRITSVWLAADSRFHPHIDSDTDTRVRAKYQLPERFVLYLGGFDVRKNVHTLLLAYTYVSRAVGEEVPLILAGRPPTAWGTARFPDLPRYADQLELGQSVRWLGEIDEADKPSLYRLAAIMAFPSRYEGFGLPPLEAMACGTPVVACQISCIPEIVGDAAFLVDPDDARAMGGAILGILFEPPLAGQLRNIGLNRASLFNWQKTAEETLMVYRRALGKVT